MSSVIGWMVDETNFRFILFLVSHSHCRFTCGRRASVCDQHRPRSSAVTDESWSAIDASEVIPLLSGCRAYAFERAGSGPLGAGLTLSSALVLVR
jgi:hypothetical protein